jgi:hypothetical protein
VFETMERTVLDVGINDESIWVLLQVFTSHDKGYHGCSNFVVVVLTWWAL